MGLLYVRAMCVMDDFPLSWEDDLQEVTDIHLTRWHDVLDVRVRQSGAMRAAVWSEYASHGLWQWCMWHGALIQASLQVPRHTMIRVGLPARALRISYVPMLMGERLVVRLHHNYAHIPRPCFAHYHHAPGLTLIFGVTGSGKTTYAYQLLDHVSTQYAVVAIEDPPECMSTLWPQFDKAIFQSDLDIHHAVLRQNPDVLFWGEMRDKQAWRCVENWITTGLHIVTTIHAHNLQQCMDRLKILGAHKDFLARYLLHVHSCDNYHNVLK